MFENIVKPKNIVKVMLAIIAVWLVAATPQITFSSPVDYDYEDDDYQYEMSQVDVEMLDAASELEDGELVGGDELLLEDFDNNLISVAIGATPGESCARHTAIYQLEVGTVKSLSICDPLEGYRFSHWESSHVAVEFANAAAPETTFVVPQIPIHEIIGITAVFVPIGDVNLTSIGINATPGESCARHTAIYQLEVGTVKSLDICDPLEGYRFSHWESSYAAVEFVDATAPSTTFVVPQTQEVIIITAVFAPIGDVNQIPIWIREICSRPIQLFEVGTVVSLSTCDPLEGYRFSHWESSHVDVEFANASVPETTFVVPQIPIHEIITITAIYAPTNENSPTIPQASIDAMYHFIENNSADNPFIVPAGLTFSEAKNALDWGEGITVWAPMSGLGSPPGTLGGSIILVLNEQVHEDGTYTYDDTYGFDALLYVQYEEDVYSQRIPQTSIDAMYDLLANNSEENPFIIPRGSNLTSAMKELDWGEGITLWLVLESHDRPDLFRGEMALILNERTNHTGDIYYDDIYWFIDVSIFVQYKDAQSTQPGGTPNQPSTTRPNLPQTGVATTTAALAGGVALVSAGIIAIVIKKKEK